MRENNINRRFAFDVNVGEYCNFRCSYCFERKHSEQRFMDKRVIDRTIDLFHQVRDAGFDLHLNFWGGEPLAYPETVERFLAEFQDDDRVRWLMYTNGWFLNDRLPMLKKYLPKYGERLYIQVSHDFVSPELTKRHCPGEPAEQTVKRVLENFGLLFEAGFNCGLKTTGDFEFLENHLYDQYVNFINFTESIGSVNERLAVTPDTCATRYIDEEKFGAQLKKLLVHFKERRLKPTRFAWFDEENRKLNCTAGIQNLIVDYNGNIKYCHGCLYHNDATGADDNMVITNVFDDNCLFKAKFNHVDVHRLDRPCKQCQECDVALCFRCNALNCNRDVTKWDAPNPPNMCALYRFLSKYIEAYRVISAEF